MKEIKKKLMDAKLAIFKEELEAEGFSYDVESLDELKNELKEDLSKFGYQSMMSRIKQINDNVDKALSELEEITTSKAEKVVAVSGKVASPIARAATFGLASRTAILLAPTLVSKLAVSGAITASSVYRLVRNRKNGNIIAATRECDSILRELEITRDSNGAVVDTRFSNEMQVEIRHFLNERRVFFDDTGYLSLRKAIYSLGFEDKKSLCNILNNKLGRGLDVEDDINSKKKSVIKSIGKGTCAALGTTASGLGVATAVNSVDPAIIASPLNGTALGVFMANLTNSSIFAGVLGVTGGVGGAVLENVPVVGGLFENVLAMENLLACGVIGLGVGVGGIVITNVAKAASRVYNQVNDAGFRKDVLVFDREKYREANAREYGASLDFKKRNESREERIVFELVYPFIQDDLEDEATNYYELKNDISMLNGKEKRKVKAFVLDLKDANDESQNDFTKVICQVGRGVSLVVALGLSGLSIYDIIMDGTVIPEISRELFSEVPNNIYMMIPEKKEIAGIDYLNNVGNDNSDLGMIEDIDGTRALYHKLESMQRETTYLGEKASQVQQDIISGKNEITSGNVIDSAVDGVKDFFQDPAGKIGEAWGSIQDGAKDVWDTISDPDKVKEVIQDTHDSLTETKYVADTDSMAEVISQLDDSQLADLAYYYNSSTEVDPSSVTYQTIGNLLQTKIGIINQEIRDYNEKMTLIDTASRIVTGTSEVLTAGAQLTKKKEVK